MAALLNIVCRSPETWRIVRGASLPSARSASDEIAKVARLHRVHRHLTEEGQGMMLDSRAVILRVRVRAFLEPLLGVLRDRGHLRCDRRRRIQFALDVRALGGECGCLCVDSWRAADALGRAVRHLEPQPITPLVTIAIDSHG
jgi:hypothetical protein